MRSLIRNATVTGKMIAAPALLLGLLLLAGILGLYSARSIQANLREISQVRLHSINYLVQADRDLNQLLSAERSMIFTNTTAPEFAELLGEYEQNLEQARQRVDKYSQLIATTQEQQLINRYTKAREEWLGYSRQIVQGRQEDSRDGRRLAIDLSMNQARSSFATMRSYLDTLEDLNLQLAAGAEKKAQSTYTTIVLLLLLVIVSGAGAAALILWYLHTTIARPIVQTAAMLQDISEGEGDLTKRLTVLSEDDIGRLARSFNSFIDKLATIMGGVNTDVASLRTAGDKLSHSTASIATASTQMSAQSSVIATTSQDATQRVSSIAAAAEQMSTTMLAVATAIEQMHASIDEVARNCQRELSAVSNANMQTQSAQAQMKQLGLAANKISSIVEVINDIADQTNLLALNATIEAASAGESGKGFAVVASEVKALAKQTALATSEIEQQISDMQSIAKNSITIINDITTVMEEVNSISQTIVSAVEEQSATVSEIASNVGGAKDAATEIAANVSQTSQGLSDISSNIQGFNQGTLQTSTNIQSIKHQSEELALMAERLQRAIGQFKL